MNRFALLSDQDLLDLENSSKNKNTERATKQWIAVYEGWAENRGYKKDLHCYPPVELDSVLGRFFGEIRKKNDQDYEPVSLRVMQSALHRFLLEKKYGLNILTDERLQGSRNILEGKARQLRESGMGKKPNRSVPLTAQEEEMLWSTGRLGMGSPTSLVRTLWFLNIQHFGLRGVQEHTTMMVEDFERKVDDQGVTYIEFKEGPTKCRQKGLHPNMRATNPKMFATGGPRYIYL